MYRLNSKTRDINIKCSKWFNWNLYFYVSGKTLHFEAYKLSRTNHTNQNMLIFLLPTPAHIHNVNFKAIWWIFFKSSSDNMLNSINDFQIYIFFTMIFEGFKAFWGPFKLLCQKLLISLKKLVNSYRHNRFPIPSCPGYGREDPYFGACCSGQTAHKPVQQSRQQALRAYGPNIYTVCIAKSTQWVEILYEDCFYFIFCHAVVLSRDLYETFIYVGLIFRCYI